LVDSVEKKPEAGIQALFPADRGGIFAGSGASVNDDMLIYVSRKALEMLMRSTHRLAVEA